MLHTVDVRKFFSVDSYVIFKYILFDKWAISYAFYSILFLLQYILYTLHSSQFPVTHPLDLCLAAFVYTPFVWSLIKVILHGSFPSPFRGDVAFRLLSSLQYTHPLLWLLLAQWALAPDLLLTSHCPTPTIGIGSSSGCAAAAADVVSTRPSAAGPSEIKQGS